LFSFATSETHFLFKGKFYDEVDGVAMGSPLAPILANLFLGVHEVILTRLTFYSIGVMLMILFALLTITFPANRGLSRRGKNERRLPTRFLSRMR